ncbi:ABC transporter permease [Rhizobium leguminosarum bv. trifolii]|jgi:ribose transport system permease protein|uniref:ABC transporter permease n=1 Tax=Rhizobium ruizarguesonis TaxID=2081791 RepID=A0AAE8QHC8_9HYPH|nr:ABC transporter permease [Rhizobium ruizarguesonis]MBY5806820.1 ABC transporter permease [Rhizobium leguminosarum]NKL15006.1 ABC transporter permease [Rhizobium leguminosarum bv. viciae]QIO45401.1 ABC transporter permease [Rhizobium leguminosarum bv. trifolii]MBY5847049.1 ABC transporter permease [Rhizobium leguminosarum]MBY5853278.1 ABC transporter permease [Rhizobium leguminosarum]
MEPSTTTSLGRAPPQLVGGWEAGLLLFLGLLYFGGAIVNPAFFGSTEALHALLRDTSRVGIIAVGMTFVIANKDLDLSVGSTYGLVAVVFARLFAPSFLDFGVIQSVLLCVLLGTAIGLINGVLVTVLKVPAFIATLTILFIGRGFVLALTHGQAIYYSDKAKDHPLFFHLGETNILGFNNQIAIFFLIAMVGAYVLAKTRWGYETFATGGNEQAAAYAGIRTRWVRIRAYLLSSLCATLAALLSAAQDKGVTPLYGVSWELTVIASVVIGGASILGGRGRVIGSCLGAAVVVLIDKVLREGWPITRIVVIDGENVSVGAKFTLPAGAVLVFLGLLLVIAVLIEPLLIRRQVAARLWAWLRGRPPPPAYEMGGVAIEGVQTKGAMAADMALSATGLGKFLARRDALAIILTVVLWLTGLVLRPDYWWNLPNTFAILLNYTELALITVGLTYVIAAGDIDLSVGAVLALAGSTAAYFLKVLGADPLTAVTMGLFAGMTAGAVNAMVVVGFKLPAFIATLGMFYIARGLAAWFVAGQQLTGWPEGYNLLGRKVNDVLLHFGLALPPGIVRAVAEVVSVQTIWMFFIAVIAGIMLAYTPFGLKVCAAGGNVRAAAYAGINTNRVRFISLMLSALCATMAGIINVAYFRSFNPVAGQFRELDAIASVIIGGGSIFGGYGTMIGSLAGAAVITLVRALLQLNVQGFSMPQHWINVFIGVILIVAVLIDIWVRQANIFGRLRTRLARGAQARESSHG